MNTGLAIALPPGSTLRKPPASEGQYNCITGAVDVVPEQMVLPLPPVDDAVRPDDRSVILLATENGSQLFVSGFGLFIGKKSERVVVKQGKAVCAQVPFMRLQEMVIASRGIRLSSDLIEEMCERGIRIAFRWLDTDCLLVNTPVRQYRDLVDRSMDPWGIDLHYDKGLGLSAPGEA
ncbi:MAG: CRISPR-associated endonuclease Cas1 [Acidobacteriia bacterium]|nr:CRISPR-associated endonuclease Cas1 [Terriglobia bacterium]